MERLASGERLFHDGRRNTFKVGTSPVHGNFARALLKRGVLEHDFFGGYRLKNSDHTPAKLAAHPLIAPLIEHAAGLGWTVELKEICEDSETPGVPGGIAGVCCHSRKAIKIRILQRSVDEIKAALEHELRHVRGEEHAGDDAEHGLACGGMRSNALGD